MAASTLTAGFTAAGIHQRRTPVNGCGGVNVRHAQGSAEVSPDMRKLLSVIRAPTNVAGADWTARRRLADLLTDNLGIGRELDPYFDVLPLANSGEADDIWDEVRLRNRGAMMIWEPADGATEAEVAAALWDIAHANFNGAVAAQAARGLVWEDRSFEWDECQYLLTGDALDRLSAKGGRDVYTVLSGWGPQTWERACGAALGLMPAEQPDDGLTKVQLQEAFESALGRLLNDDAFMRRSAE